MSDLESLFIALEFAAQNHIFQRRKGSLNIPYINHPIKVCSLLIKCGEYDNVLLTGAILHDIVEDTPVTLEDIQLNFGRDVANLVAEVSDDMSLSKEERKRKQVEKAPLLSTKAKLIKIADKACNMEDLLTYPIWWTKGRKIAYFKWSYEVFLHCKNNNEKLDEYFLKIYRRGMEEWGENIEI